MLFSVFLSALVSLTVKRLKHIPAVEIVTIMSMLALAANYVMLRYHKVPVWGQHRRLLLARGITSTLGVILYFFTIQNIPLPSAMILRYTAPIFTALIGVFMLNELIRVQQWLFFGLSFLGVILVHGFKVDEASWYILSGLGSAFFKGLSNSIIRRLEHEEHPQVITFYGYMSSLPLAGIYFTSDYAVLQGQDWFFIGCISVLGYLGHYNTVRAFQFGPIVPVSAIAYLSIVYALLFNYFLLHETLSWTKLSGIALVLLGVLLNVFYKHTETTDKKK